MQLPPHFVEWANLIALQDFHVYGIFYIPNHVELVAKRIMT
jgi:hypothetical protein